MKYRLRILLKLLAVSGLTFLLIFLIREERKTEEKKQPLGELMKTEEIQILLEEISSASLGQVRKEDIQLALQEEQETYLSYGTYLKLIEMLLGKEKAQESGLLRKEYDRDHFLLKKDWYDCYPILLEHYRLTGLIREETLAIVCGDRELTGDLRLSENQLLDGKGNVWNCISGQLKDLAFVVISAYVHDDRILTLKEIREDLAVLQNVWIMEAEDKGIRFFFQGYEIQADIQMEKGRELREQVADLSSAGGKLTDIKIKDQRISGKLLGITDERAEIEGKGSFPIAENCVGYQLYETLRSAGREELSIGYDFADFVLDNGKICAFLILRKDKMDSIRVALKTNGFENLYHQRILLTSQDGLLLSYGNYENRVEKTIPPGEKLEITAASPYLSSARAEVRPLAQSGKIQILSLERSQGVPAYRGKLEIVLTPQGLALINEVLLEEYLYSVVPSEMPASYPPEALKAQAVCARTYAFPYLSQPGYGVLGAHVDDSVSYQVYNNIQENVETTKAVKETAGMLLMYQGKPVRTYYYSTSCGFGTDAGIWQEENRENMSYLISAHIASEEEGILPRELSAESCFETFIRSVGQYDYEKQEPWYRWSYEVKELSLPRMEERLKERSKAAGDKILLYKGEGDPKEDPMGFEPEKPGKIREIYDMECIKRRDGGVMEELLIHTDAGTYKVVSEYNIRYILNQGGQVIRQDGSLYQSDLLLPSAYMIIEPVKSGENMIGYKIYGGGCGHGVGMSQNGARAMGLAGLNSKEILSFFYKNCSLEKWY